MEDKPETFIKLPHEVIISESNPLAIKLPKVFQTTIDNDIFIDNKYGDFQ